MHEPLIGNTTAKNFGSFVKAINLADQYGAMLAQAAEVKKALDALRKQLVALDQNVIDGLLFRVTVSHSASTLTDWKAVVEAIQPDPDLVKLYQTTEPKTTVRATARKAS